MEEKAKQRKTKKNTIISIQGNIGSFSHIAVNEIFKDKSFQLFERGSFAEVFDDLQQSRSEYALIPIENSTYGSITQNFDLFLNNTFEIIGEVYLKINFHLIALPNVKFEMIRELYSHPVGLGQIKKFLKNNPQIKPIDYHDTAGAVLMLKEKKLTTAAAAASRYAAKIYKLKIIKLNIHENKQNYTRFLLIKRVGKSKVNDKKNIIGQTGFKLSITFVLKDTPGSLYKVLEIFAKRNINLTKIESRPILNTRWSYKFFIDLEFKNEIKSLKLILNQVKKQTSNFTILGSYKKGKYLST